MAVNLSSGSATIVGSVSTVSSVPTLSATQTLVNGAVSTTGSNQNVYTVSASKVFYLYGFGITDSGGNLYVYKSDGTTLLARNNTAAANPIMFTSGVPIAAYTATTNVVMKGDAGHTYSFWGIEQ
jgi:hypothetical protein